MNNPSATVRISYNRDYDEFRVIPLTVSNPTEREDKTSYTNDAEDAYLTALHMAEKDAKRIIISSNAVSRIQKAFKAIADGVTLS